jgi:hypothetical protein
MLPSHKGYAVDISYFMRNYSVKRGCAPSGNNMQWTYPFCRGYTQSRVDMLPSGKGYGVDISSLKRILKVKCGYAPQWQRIAG